MSARAFQHFFDRVTTQSSAREFREAERLEREFVDRVRTDPAYREYYLAERYAGHVAALRLWGPR